MKFSPFSEKQLTALTWWCASSPYNGCDALICDGAVRSGKTVCMGISFIAWAFYRFDGGVFALCGKTIRSLRRNVILPIVPIMQSLGFECRERISSNSLDISKNGRKNTFYYFGGKDEGSAALIQGMTLSGVLFDEVALMPRSFVEQALARCSVSGSKFWFNCNPEHPQHWFRQEWILRSEEKNALYIHFKMYDNPSLSPEMIRRYQTLYTGAFYERFIEGRWVSADGAVYPFMSLPDAFVPVPDVEFTRFVISCDYGTVNPASFGLWGLYDGVWYRISEYYYNSRITGCQRTDEEHYEALCELAGSRIIDTVVVDPSAASFIQVIERHGRFSVIPAKNQVLDGIRNVSSALKEKRIRICSVCMDSMREFGMYRWANGSRDAPVKENDHAMDDIRYFVTTVLNNDNDEIFAIAAWR